MFSQMTVAQVLGWAIGILFTGGAIAVLIQRYFPWWDNLPAWVKNVILVAINQAGAALLAGLLAVIPQAYQGLTIEQIVTGLLMAAASYILHYLDQIFADLNEQAKLNRAMRRGEHAVFK